MLINAEILYIINALKPYESKLVGGVVRDFLQNGTIAEDIDIATQATPEITTKLLENAGLKVFPTGLKHGTVTAIYKNKPYEITTLRRDTQTNGRHAEVVFTTSFNEDAQRRDFTFNALYMDETGHIDDYFNGQEDLKNETVRFIGDAQSRISEDYLRILRFFRFHGKFKSKPQFNENVLNIIKNNSKHLTKLSKERITSELFKILKGPHIADIWQALETTNCLECLDIKKPDIQSLKQLNKSCDSITKLLCLYPNIKTSCVFILTNKQKKEIKQIQKVLTSFNAEKDLYQQAYTFGDTPLLKACEILKAQNLGNTVYDTFIQKLTGYRSPLFPITGALLIQRGQREGPQLGKTLKQIEKWWVKNNFPSADVCLMHFKL